MQRIINGIQQIGVGVENLYEAFAWYRQNFNMNIKVFEEKAVAELMLPYTANQKRERQAILAMTIHGGGGFEIWQHTGKKPEPIGFDMMLGDLGINITKMKTHDIEQLYKDFKKKEIQVLTDINKDIAGQKHFFVKDPYGNIFQFVENDDVFYQEDHYNGGVMGCIIGVTDIEKSKKFYAEILNYEIEMASEEGVFNDLKYLPGSEHKFKRAILTQKDEKKGGFSKLLGKTQIELVEVQERKQRNLFENRLWGDPGFIHLCFDVSGMESFREFCKEKGHPFTVDSAESFDMGEAAGHFSYIEDPDGTLIEFVETHKVPIVKKLGWNMKLKNRNPRKPLPDWMIKTLRWKKVKE
jgi:catechol 2,3-dioxygenase-like lactoylglutathione lyase family enzyme/uncharacterized glyoxalase superfamily protein PhnB